MCSPRAALVWDHCGRGSLEDVLKADDIRLDWTFRLSLLTDVVRGLRYVHTSPLRVHGRLSSRNCVVDARWVLRLTDLGLPDLLRAQGLPPRARSSRGEYLLTQSVASPTTHHPHSPACIRRAAVDGAGVAARGTRGGARHAGRRRVLPRHHHARGHRARRALLHAVSHARR